MTEEEFECPECDNYIGTKYGLIAHFGNAHPDSDIDDPTGSYVEFNCDNCGDGVKRLEKHVERVDGNYCSTQCSSESQEKKEEFTCNRCGKKFKECPSLRRSKNAYCSYNCWDGRARLEKECDRCGESMTITESQISSKENTFCSVLCADKFKKVSEKESNATEFSRTPAGVAWSRTVRERDEWECQDCGKEENLEAHHIKRRVNCEVNENGIDERLALWNGVTLCGFCHAMRHQDEQVFHLMKSGVENWDERVK